MTPFTCHLAASGVARATLAEMATLRKEPLSGTNVPVGVLKHADEQAVVGVIAVLKAVRASGRPASDFADWGVAAAPRYFGRLAAAAVIARHKVRGAPGVSPLVAPQMSLHSLAGTVSLALGCHGPVSGLGGGVDALSDGMTGGMTVLCDAKVPGVWVVLTAYDPEPTAADDPAAVCHAVALGLTANAGGVCIERCDEPTSAGSVAALGRFLENDLATNWDCALTGGWRLSIATRAIPAAKAA